ncbi:rod shape-determining protein MreD [Reinekea marina]|uniref:Rod shape-determining protein MreD n=1 Tax=Reinekea marina TaxID=1310421 RepID=A0ABV7WX52_9GAMM|nr:rod shape-determining protein MreD [Reinekea marina]MBU2863109.1 rod shape-determining protein MreD [Reinekea forsetii]MDN3650191.1 rod shape-determining protein MreD [Reinekea marina]
MKQKPPHGLWLIAVSFFIAFSLAAVPIPGQFQLARPDFVGLFLIFWCLVLPERFGITMAFVVGILYDTLIGTQLGTYGLVFSSVAYLVLLLNFRLRMYPLGQQAMVVFLILGISHVLVQWLKDWFVGGITGEMQIWPALVSAIVWPWVYGIGRNLMQYFRVQ